MAEKSLGVCCPHGIWLAGLPDKGITRNAHAELRRDGEWLWAIIRLRVRHLPQRDSPIVIIWDNRDAVVAALVNHDFVAMDTALQMPATVMIVDRPHPRWAGSKIFEVWLTDPADQLPEIIRPVVFVGFTNTPLKRGFHWEASWGNRNGRIGLFVTEGNEQVERPEIHTQEKNRQRVWWFNKTSVHEQVYDLVSTAQA